jgi:hypothetical protein
LSNAWKNLRDKGIERNHTLDLSLKAQEFFFEAGEVESWLVEKNDVLNSTDYGRDRDAATKLLTKHKVHFALDKYPERLDSFPLVFLLCFSIFFNAIGKIIKINNSNK